MKQNHSVSRRLALLAMLTLCLMTFFASCGECDHQWGDWTISEKPSCETAGTQVRSCSLCGESQNEALAATGHHYDTYVQNGDATCQSDMTESAPCAHCDKTDTRTVQNSKDPAKHTSTDLRYEVGDGESHNVVRVCCGAVAQTAAHRWDEGVTDPANTQNTLYTCLDCRATKSVAPTEHVHRAEKIEATPAGCTTYGNVEHWFCQGCSTRFTDATLSRTMTEAQTKIAPAHTSEAFVYALHATDPNSHEKRHACCNTLVETAAHEYESTGNFPATCTTNGYTTYRCVCGATYNTDNAPATGHNVEFWELDHELLEVGTSCSYTQTFTGTCFSCSQTVEKSVDIIRHSYVATVTAHPTCKTTGSKTYACACGATPTVATTPIDINPDAHHWDDGVTQSGVTTYTCQHGCGKTKTAVIYTEPTQDLDKSVLTNNEIILGGVSMKLDETTLGLLDNDPAKKVTVTANPVTDRDALINALPEALRGQITASTPIYDFSLSQGGIPISQFGDGRITITLPYELPADADADCVAVWYVNAMGELSFYEATYYEAAGEGFVIFDASHFSTYLPGIAPSRDACELYGHNYEEKVTSPTCDQKGYTEYHCQRCGESKIDDVTDAQGHAYDAGTGTPSTCTVAGKMTYSCTRAGCEHTLERTLATAPHNWQYVVNESTHVSCTEDGVAVYRCGADDCDAKKTEITESWGFHDLYDASAVLAQGATSCTDGVVVTIKCHSCNYSETETRTDSHIRIDKLGYDEFGYITIPETKILLGAYLQNAGISYTDEPYIILTHGCFCGAVKDRVSLFNGMSQHGELFSGWVDFSSSSPFEQTSLVQTMPFMDWDPILQQPIESPVFKIFFQSVITRVGCHETYSVTIKIGYDEATQQATETLTYVLHEYDWHKNTKVTATLDDPSKTCFENCPVVNSTLIYGIHVTETCLDCGEVLRAFDDAVTTSSSHYFCPTETYEYHDESHDDSYYGLRVFINECPCGQIDYNLYQGDCRFSRTRVGDTEIYQCDDCGLIYAEKTEEIEDEENCRYTFTRYLYLDCDSVDAVENCAKTVVCHIIDEERHYSVTTQTNRDNPTSTEIPCRYHYYSKNICDECGKETPSSYEGYLIIHDENTATTTDSHGNVTTSVTCRAEGCGYHSITVTDKDGYTLREYYSMMDHTRGELQISLATWKMVGEEMRYTLTRNEYYSADGTELLRWDQSTYTYRTDPEKGCICTETFSNHEGDDYVNESLFCRFEEGDSQPKTCFQDGYAYQICSVCGYKEYLYYEPTRGHEFYDGSCTWCGEPCEHEFDDYGMCVVCHMMCTHDWEEGVCSVCNNACPHGPFEDSVCLECGKTCEHEYLDGQCILCWKPCEHAWSEGVCTVCHMSCPHGPFDEDRICTECGQPCEHHYEYGSCIGCGKPCEHEFDGQSICTVCSQECGHSWENGICTECGKVCAHEYYDGWCQICWKECDHEWTDATCTVCSATCYHSWNSDGSCSECGTPCAHEYYDGWCQICWKECDHEWTDGTCTVCSATCYHSWNGGTCAECGMPCEHDYHDGQCTICWIPCDHRWTDGMCTVCGMMCHHGYYDNGVCFQCGRACEHEFYDGSCTICWIPCEHRWNNGACSVCNMTCPHGSFEDSVCTECGKTCEHEYYEGMCIKCYAECPHTWEYGTCTQCYMSCTHDWVDGTCGQCNELCNHVWENSVCFQCGTECQHEYYDGNCGICWKNCEHAWSDGVCLECGMSCPHEFFDGACPHCGKPCSHDGYFPGELCGVCNAQL